MSPTPGRPGARPFAPAFEGLAAQKTTETAAATPWRRNRLTLRLTRLLPARSGALVQYSPGAAAPATAPATSPIAPRPTAPTAANSPRENTNRQPNGWP